MGITVSAPGKAILMGEHAAVYGRPALVAALDRRLYAQLTATRSAGVTLELPEVGVSETVPWGGIRDYADAARAHWANYQEQPGPETFRLLRGDDPAHLVKVALGEALAMAARNGLVADEVPGVEVRLRSEIPIGAGFGSSAAAAVAIAYACLRLHGIEVEPAEFEGLGLEIERRQHGSPSGIDTATVIRGGLVWAVRDGTGALAVEPVEFSAEASHGIRVFNSGTPVESTGAVVAAVRARRDADPPGFERLFERMETSTRTLRERLESGQVPMDLIAPIRQFEACLEEAGVVPLGLRKIVREVEARGGAAKISGAGALSGRGAGSLLVHHPQAEKIDRWSFLEELESLDVRLGAEGVRVEDPQ